MTLHLSMPGAHRSSQQQEEVREARRLLKERIRNDWEYATLPAYRSSGAERASAKDGEDTVAGFRFHALSIGARDQSSNGGGQALGLDFEPVEWREREENSDTEGESSAVSAVGSSSKRKDKDKDIAYQFEGPDSVATQLAERRSARKRKRLEVLQEEAAWNDGLSHFIQRRNQWCCARPTADVRLADKKSVELADSSSAESSSPRTSTSTSSTSHSSTPATSPSATPDVMGRESASSVSLAEVLVPVAPPMLPNHPIRRRINSNTYPELYSKVILQSRTPSVPINLSTLVKALVQGWKDDGEWPPKSGPLEPSIGRKKGAEGGLRHGIKRVLRVVDSGRKNGEG